MTMTEVQQYKNPFTLDGRVKPMAFVTPAKVAAVKNLVEDAMSGNHIAAATLREAMTSTDAIFSFAYLTQINFLPQFDRLPRQWEKIAGRRTLNDFRKPVLYSMIAEWDGPGVLGPDPLSTNGIIPTVPEAGAYPYAFMSGEESKAQGIVKRGFKTAFTFEAFVNDALGFIQSLPDEMTRIALDTEEYEVFNGLIAGLGAGQQLAGGTTPDGTIVAANSPLTRSSVIRAKFELSQRRVNGRYVQVNGGYNLLVGIGQAAFAEYQLANTLVQTRTGVSDATHSQYIFSPASADGLGGIEIIETPYVTGTNWYLLPKPGTTSRPILERGFLRGHEVPELRVQNTTGVYLGGGSVSPFEGSFENDTAEFRLRMFGAGILWSPELVIWSTGAGS